MLIELHNVYKIYGEGLESEVRALDGVSLQVDRGEFVAVVGASGSGKSTMMNVLGCLDIPTRGTYLLGGTDVRELTDKELSHIRNKQIGFIFQGFNLIPAVMFFCGLLAVFEQLGAYKASEILFRPLLRPLLGIPGKCGIAFISSFTGSDVAAVMTRDLYEEGSITDDERTIFVAYQYAGSACINNTITGGAPLVAISPVALGPCILIMVFCKIIGANIVRIILRLSGKKRSKEGKTA